MAGGVLKGTVGVVLLILAVALLLGGLGALVYGAMDQQENEDEGLLGPDRERSEQNEELVAGGAVATGVGVLLLVLSIVLIVTAGRRDEPEAPQADPADAEPPIRTASVDEPRRDQPTSSPPRGVVGMVVGIAMTAILLASFLALTSGGDTLFGRQQDPVIDREQHNGTLQAGVDLPGAPATLTFALGVPAGAETLRVELDWQETLGADALRMALEVQRGGEWVEVTAKRGGPGTALEAGVAANEAHRLTITRTQPGSMDVEVGALVTYRR